MSDTPQSAVLRTLFYLVSIMLQILLKILSYFSKLKVSQILCNLYTQCSMCPKKTFISPQKYHDSVLHMLSQLLKCVPKTKTNIYFSGKTCYWPLTKSWFKDFTLPHLESCSNTIPMTTVHVSVSIGFRTPATSKVEISVRTVNGFQLFTFVTKNSLRCWKDPEPASSHFLA